jgi:predicted MFS family arabinose efflux permease
MVFGIGTAGITLYNEPLIKLSGTDESGMFVVLFVQPVALMLITFLGGILGDHVSRERAIILNSILAIISLTAFILISKNPASLKQGILWGAMTAFYYNAEAVFQLVILETANFDCIGRMAAISTCFYGIGDGLGMVLANILTGKSGMIAAKCIVTIPVLVAVSIVLMLCDNSKSRVAE